MYDYVTPEEELECLKMVFKGRIPSKKNSKNIIYKNGHPLIISSKQHAAWHETETWQKKKYRNKTISNVQRIYIYFQFPDNRRTDLSNKTETLMDFLVDLGVLEDDSWQKTGPLVLYPLGISKDPQTEIRILYKKSL